MLVRVLQCCLANETSPHPQKCSLSAQRRKARAEYRLTLRTIRQHDRSMMKEYLPSSGRFWNGYLLVGEKGVSYL